MNLIVTGAGGQLGRTIKADSFFSKFKTHFLERQDFDLLNTKELEEKVKQLSPSIIINAGAYTNVKEAEIDEEKAFGVNSKGVKALAGICKKLDIILIHISTDYVFDGIKNHPYKECSYTNPLNIYGQSKLEGENAIIDSECKYVILRTSWLFSEYDNNFVTNVLNSLINKVDMKFIYNQYGSPTSCKGLCDAIKVFCNKSCEGTFNQGGLFHFTGYPYVSWFDFAMEIKEVSLEKGLIDKEIIIKKISAEDYNDPVIRPQNSSLSCKKINDLFGIQPDDWRANLRLAIEKIASS